MMPGRDIVRDPMADCAADRERGNASLTRRAPNNKARALRVALDAIGEVGVADLEAAIATVKAHLGE
jgi:hypothetical protein